MNMPLLVFGDINPQKTKNFLHPLLPYVNDPFRSARPNSSDKFRDQTGPNKDAKSQWPNRPGLPPTNEPPALLPTPRGEMWPGQYCEKIKWPPREPSRENPKLAPSILLFQCRKIFLREVSPPKFLS